MKKLFFILLSLVVLSCTDEETRMEQDFQSLQNTLEAIQETAASVPCTDPTQWSFTPYGDKACGGPQGYIAYPLTIDTVAFLNRIEGHRVREEFLNNKWGISSTCDIPPQPQSVACENGLPVLVY